ncbi:DUF2993 domain-containing protein [Georgenia sp. TF02-10]|uniref:LmeA family phospholipid-binding protein n=1 Tax=Georgenia sp. TF02-10 TaxID=2917725 RepID=UPI001FA78D7C|nr:DUF2993 domain-containing protein [Georgenia sp. TF02-10]UNX54700.1 DUF2993 domain-containing protein [Georgenia sp. TF02-10]
MRRLLGVLVALVLLLAAAVVVDRVVAGRAEDQAADRIEQEVGARPDVTIEGFPFLTQLAARELGSVRATAAELPAEELVLTDVTAHARGVALVSPVTLAHVSGSGTVTSAELQRLVRARVPDLDVDVAAGTDGVRLTTEVLGAELSLRAEPVLAGEVLQVQARSVTLGGRTVEAERLAALVGRDVLQVEIPVPELPLGLRVVGVEPAADGLRVALEGSDVVVEE